MDQIEKIILETFELEQEYIVEGTPLINPALSYFIMAPKVLRDFLLKIKGDFLVAKEKLKSKKGADKGRSLRKDEDATVYKLTKEQTDFLDELRDKYGDDLKEIILEFRKEILAPYQVIKRLVKKNKTVSAKDKYGITHAEFKNALESGKNKIEKRKDFFENQKDLKRKIETQKASIENLKELRDDFRTSGKLKESVVKKVLDLYDVGDSVFSDYSIQQLEKKYNDLKKIKSKISAISTSDIEKDPESFISLMKREQELKSMTTPKKEKKEDLKEDTTAEEKRKFDTIKSSVKSLYHSDKGFNDVFAKYTLRRLLREQLKYGKDKTLTFVYSYIINEMLVDAKKKLEKLVNEKSSALSKIEFNNKERIVYQLKNKDGEKYSGDINDYIVTLKDEDFKDAAESIDRPEKLIEAERNIVNEIKKFERSLKNVITDEEYKEMKRLRLINNMISVKEWKNPNDLFKSPEEIKKQLKDEDKDE